MEKSEPDDVGGGDVEERGLWDIIREAGPAGPLALIALSLPAIGGFVLLARIDPVASWLRTHDDMGIVIYAAAFALLSGLAVLPTYAQAALGGWAFGLIGGFPAAILGIGGGALIGYVVSRRAASERVMTMIDERAEWAAVRDALVSRSRWRTLGLVTLIRLPPNSPFALTNLALGSVRAPLLTVLVATAIGLAPRTALAVYLASGVKGQFEAARPDKLWTFVATAVLTIVIVVVIGRVAQNALARVSSGAGAERGRDDDLG